jgi:hypothetical protein
MAADWIEAAQVPEPQEEQLLDPRGISAPPKPSPRQPQYDHGAVLGLPRDGGGRRGPLGLRIITGER